MRADLEVTIAAWKAANLLDGDVRAAMREYSRSCMEEAGFTVHPFNPPVKIWHFDLDEVVAGYEITEDAAATVGYRADPRVESSAALPFEGYLYPESQLSIPPRIIISRRTGSSLKAVRTLTVHHDVRLNCRTATVDTTRR